MVYRETGNATEAYRQAYDTSNMKPESINRLAKANLDNVKIASRLAELSAKDLKRHQLTIDDLIAELEEARQAALCAETPQSSAAVGATMGKAKLLGMDKQVVDHQSSDGTMTPKAAVTIDKSVIKEIAKQLNEDC